MDGKKLKELIKFHKSTIGKVAEGIGVPSPTLYVKIRSNRIDEFTEKQILNFLGAEINIKEENTNVIKSSDNTIILDLKKEVEACREEILFLKDIIKNLTGSNAQVGKFKASSLVSSGKIPFFLLPDLLTQTRLQQ